MTFSSLRRCLAPLALILLVLANLSLASAASPGQVDDDRQLRPALDGSGLFLVESGSRADEPPAPALAPRLRATVDYRRMAVLQPRPTQSPRLRLLRAPCQPQGPPRLT